MLHFLFHFCAWTVVISYPDDDAETQTVVLFSILGKSYGQWFHRCLLWTHDYSNSRWSWERKFLKALFFYQFSSISQSCLTPWDPMDCSMPGFPVRHQLLELTQTHVHHVGDAIQPSHPLSSPSHPAINLSQHQGLFQWISSSHPVAKDCWKPFKTSEVNHERESMKIFFLFDERLKTGERMIYSSF